MDDDDEDASVGAPMLEEELPVLDGFPCEGGGFPRYPIPVGTVGPFSTIDREPIRIGADSTHTTLISDDLRIRMVNG